jgi:putative DNA-invertase from lambdoid prophage Rac
MTSNTDNHAVATKNAVIYLRTSTEEQHPENQLDDCRRFAVSRGYRVEREFVEQLSAWKKDLKRPDYEEVRRLATAGSIDAVIVWSLDRWVRNRDTLIEDLGYFPQLGVRFHSVQESWLESVNIEGPLGKTIREFLYGLLGSIAQMESDRLSERTKRGLDRARRAGKRLGAPKAKFNRHRAAGLISEGWSDKRVADEVGVSKATIVRFRKGQADNYRSFINEAARAETGVREPEVKR